MSNETSKPPFQQFQEEEEIQLGTLWNRIKDSIRYLIRKWHIMLLGMALFTGLALGYAWWYGTKYVANASFAVQGENSSSALLSSALSLASSLGIGSSSHTGYDNNFFANVIQSRRVIFRALLDEGTVNGKKDVMANHYIDLYGWRDDWKNDPRLKDFYFTPKPVEQVNRLEDSILHKIYDQILDKNLEVVFDETKPFNTATFTTKSLDFSKYFMKSLLDYTSGYYNDDVYKLNKQGLDIADYRVDSIGKALKNLDARVASLKDITNNMFKQQGFLELNQSLRDQSLLNVQYSSAVNNVEYAKVSLLTNAPIIEIIDDPIFATEVSYISKVIAIVVGILLGMIITASYLLLSKFVSASAKKDKEKSEMASSPDVSV